MVKVLPFLALKPSAENAKNVASNSSISEKEMLQELESNPLSYLHIVKPHLHFDPNQQDRTKSYPFAKNYFREMISQKVIELNNYLSVYIYEQTNTDGHTFSGIITGINYLSYLEGKIKKHENTIAEKEERLIKHVQSIGAVGEPVLLTHAPSNEVQNWIETNKTNPIFEFKCKAQNKHVVYEVKDKEIIASLQQSFTQIDELYIADGHHRVAATTNYCARLYSSQNKSKTDLMFMAYILPQNQLIIKSFHRLLKNIQPQLIEDLINTKHNFNVEKCEGAFAPTKKGEIGFYYSNQWYKLSIPSSESAGLDVAFLDSEIFGKIFNITDTRHDLRLTYMRGDFPLNQLAEKVDTGKQQIVFTLYANTFEEIKEIADNNKTMPPKSTWIEPKLLTGMIIQRI